MNTDRRTSTAMVRGVQTCSDDCLLAYVGYAENCGSAAMLSTPSYLAREMALKPAGYMPRRP